MEQPKKNPHTTRIVLFAVAIAVVTLGFCSQRADAEGLTAEPAGSRASGLSREASAGP